MDLQRQADAGGKPAPSAASAERTALIHQHCGASADYLPGPTDGPELNYEVLP